MTSDKISLVSEKAAVQGTAAFSKFMTILQIISDSDELLTTAGVAKIAGLPRPTVHRIIAALLSEGMLSEKSGGQLALGPRLISLGIRSWDRSDLRQASRQPLEMLRDVLDETVHLAVNSGDEMIYIDKLESHQTVSMRSRIGTRVPLHSSSVGKAWLASLPIEEAIGIVGTLNFTTRTEHSIKDPKVLLKQLDDVREKGFSLDLEENELDICCYGVSVIGGDAKAIACISVSIPRYRFERAAQVAVVAKMQECAREIANLVG